LYSAFRKHGLDVDILSPKTKSFAGYDIVAIPGLFAWTEALREAVENFEGYLLLGPRTGSKTQNFAFPARLGPDLPQNLLDLKVSRVDSLPAGVEVSVKGGGSARLWREKTEGGAEVIMEDVEGVPVLLSQGKVFYLTASGDRSLMQRVADYLIAEADVPVMQLPAGVRCRVRGGLRIYVNYAATAQTLNKAPDEADYVVGSADMPPAGVTVVRLAKAG
jgi:beta-galactosidase